MGVMLWFVFGGITGWVAEAMIRESNQKNGHKHLELGTGYSVFVAILGALIAGWALTLVGAPTMINVNIVSVGTPVLGALAMLWLIREFSPDVYASVHQPRFKR